MIIVNLFLLFGFGWFLIKATEIVTDSLQELARLTGLGKFAITSLFLALATSMPELVVSIAAAFEGKSTLALGTILGSNIADISLVIGGAALIGGSFSVAGEWLKIDIFSIFLAGAMPLILLMDQQLSRADGVILLLIYIIYNVNLFRGQQKTSGMNKGKLLRRMLTTETRPKIRSGVLWLLGGTGMLILAAEIIVKSGTYLAQAFNMPVFLIGLFFVAIGTSLPELSFEITAIRKRQAGMALGDLFGSIVANSTLIMGLTAIISPIKLANGLNAYLLSAAVFGMMFILFWQLVKTKKKLERWEGVVLVTAYFVFMLMEWIKN